MRLPTVAGVLTPAAITATAAAAIFAPGASSSAATPSTPEPRDAVRLLIGAPVPAGPVATPGAGLEGPGLPRRAPRPSTRFPVLGHVDYGTAIDRFGVSRPGHIHQGQDVFAAPGTPLVAVRDAVVIATGNEGGRGNYVALYSSATRRTYVYFHMREPALVRVGRHVRAGKRVGRVGCTGHCSGPHLHFEIHRGRTMTGGAIDPLPLLRHWRRAR